MNRLLMLLVACFGCTITFFLSQFLGPVIASSIIGLLGGLLFKEYAGLNYAATFAGMSSISLVLSFWLSPLIGVLVFIVYLMFENLFVGVGGKLGTIALISCLAFALMTGNITLINFEAWTNLPGLLILITAVIGALMTLLVRKKLTSNVVVASALVGLVGGLFLPGHLSLVLYAASFAAMASEKKLSGYGAFAITGLFVGAIYLVLIGFFPGVGGKLGFIGFLSVLLTSNFTNSA